MPARAEAIANAWMKRLFDEGTLAAASDAALVELVAHRGDDAAFTALVERHGPTVLAVCRGVCGDHTEADDAFQATFLVLLRRAGRLRVDDSLAGWLRKVALRVARQARRTRSRRLAREARAARPEPVVDADDLATRELQAIVRQEVGRLPERYRMPVELCEFQGLGRDETARLLGWPTGTVAGRLARARVQLRGRLERRGLGPEHLATLALPATRWHEALEISTRSATSLFPHGASSGAVGRLATLAERLAWARSGAVAAALMVAAVTIGIAAASANPPRDVAPAVANAPSSPSAAPKQADANDPRLAGHFEGRVVDPDGKPIANARVYAVPDSDTTGPGPVRARTGSDGRFAFDAPDLTFRALDDLPARRQGRVMAAADGFAPGWMVTWGETGGSFRSHWDPVQGAPLEIRLARKGPSIRGRLLRPDGAPLAGARVRVREIRIPRNHNLDAHLQRERNASAFTMTDYAASAYHPSSLPDVNTQTKTDADGRFTLDGLGADRLVVLGIQGEGVADAAPEVMTRPLPIDAPHPLPTRWPRGSDFEYTLPGERRIHVTVRDRDTQEPLNGAWVSPHRAVLSGLEVGTYPDTTDARGERTFTGLSQAPNPNLDAAAIPAPGDPHFSAAAGGCQRKRGDRLPAGIPFRLTVRDDAGKPLRAKVAYSAVQPNPHFRRVIQDMQSQAGTPLSLAADRGEGVHEGVALPGPGVITVEAADRNAYRSAFVDPKAYFAGPHELVAAGTGHHLWSS
ncbi:MAG: sigma-70 family RNA polymerase sigma factor [Isosphaeraceae bacterium]